MLATLTKPPLSGIHNIALAAIDAICIDNLLGEQQYSKGYTIALY